MNQLEMWTVYDKPTDFPKHFVARKFLIGKGGATPTTDYFMSETLEDLREKLPKHLTCLPRFEEDEPHIVEVWL